MSPVESSALEHNYIGRSQYTDSIAVGIDRDGIVMENVSEPQRSQVLLVDARACISGCNLKVTAGGMFLGLYLLSTIADQVI